MPIIILFSSMILKLFYEKINITLFKPLKKIKINYDFCSFLYQKNYNFLKLEKLVKFVKFPNFFVEK